MCCSAPLIICTTHHSFVKRELDYSAPPPTDDIERCEPIFAQTEEGKEYITSRGMPHFFIPIPYTCMPALTTVSATKTAGGYYKNTRCEWASLVCTPSEDLHQSALAFTRYSCCNEQHYSSFGEMCQYYCLRVLKPSSLSSLICEGHLEIFTYTDMVSLMSLLSRNVSFIPYTRYVVRKRW